MPYDRYGNWKPRGGGYLADANTPTICDYLQCYCCCLAAAENAMAEATGQSGQGAVNPATGQPYSSSGSPPPAADANSTAAGGTLPATGQPATGAPATTTTGAPATSGIMANLTNFSTPYPYVAIGGAILLVALLTGGSSKGRNGSAPPIIHYG
jgi:hypothetical protein